MRDDVDYELPELGASSGQEDAQDGLDVEVFRHVTGARHRLRQDIALDDDGNIVSRGGSIGSLMRDVVIIITLALVISVVVKTFLLKPFYIPSASMHDTLIEEDRVLVNQLVPGPVALNRGDIIVFEDPSGWLPQTPKVAKNGVQSFMDGALEFIGLKPEETNKHLIKRVIGLPGDEVECCNAYGQVMINDVPVHEPYIVLGNNTAASGTSFKVKVPAESVWVMGDNRYNSADSRAHRETPTGGFIPYDRIVGRAFMINWPLNRIQFLGNYPEVFAGVPTRQPE